MDHESVRFVAGQETSELRPAFCGDNSACRIAALLVPLLALTAAWLSARQDAIDRPMIDRIRQEGLARSGVMEFYKRFVTVDGPRLTGSPAHKASAEWARQRPSPSYSEVSRAPDRYWRRPNPDLTEAEDHILDFFAAEFLTAATDPGPSGGLPYRRGVRAS